MSPNFCVAYFFEGKMAGPGETLGSPQRGTELLVQQIAPVSILPISITLDVRYLSRPSAYVNVGKETIVKDVNDSKQILLTIEDLSRTTLKETTDAQEYEEKLSAKGWKKLW